MNITVVGDRSFSVAVTIEFYDFKKLWKHFVRADTVDVEEISGDNIASVVFTVVGRRPEEIKRITLDYDGHTVILDPGPDKFRDLKPIVIYSEGRDFWTNQLRQRAKEAEHDGSI